LTDRGGFSRLNTTYPEWDLRAVQSNPQLWERAYQAAWSSNVFALSKLNISNVILGNDPTQPLILRDSNIVPGADVFPITSDNYVGCSFNPQNAAAIAPNEFGCYVNTDRSLPEDAMFDDAPSLISKLPLNSCAVCLCLVKRGCRRV
jgi:hypothetical protein